MTIANDSIVLYCKSIVYNFWLIELRPKRPSIIILKCGAVKKLREHFTEMTIANDSIVLYCKSIVYNFWLIELRPKRPSNVTHCKALPRGEWPFLIVTAIGNGNDVKYKLQLPYGDQSRRTDSPYFVFAERIHWLDCLCRTAIDIARIAQLSQRNRATLRNISTNKSLQTLANVMPQTLIYALRINSLFFFYHDFKWPWMT